jgi:hypothetical protein
MDLGGAYNSEDDEVDDEAYDADETASLLSKATRGAGLRFRGKQSVSGLAAKGSALVSFFCSLTRSHSPYP